MIKWIRRLMNRGELYTLYIHFGKQGNIGVNNISLFEVKLKNKNIEFINECLKCEDPTVREMMLIMIINRLPEDAFERELYNIDYLKRINLGSATFSIEKY